MRIVDAHVHVRGPVEAADILKQMDERGIDRTILLSEHERNSLEVTREKLLRTKKLFDAAPERLSGLAWVNPAIEGAIDLVTEALTEMGYVGVKIIPDHWFVYEDRFVPFWTRLNELHASILFHTGILYGWEDSSRFCRPVYLETMIHYPNIRFAMAHVSWPWCDECLATFGSTRFDADENGRKPPAVIDLTPGIPPYLRKQVIANAIDFAGVEHIMYGTDGSLPGKNETQLNVQEDLLRIFDELELSAADKQRLLAGTADDLFPPRG